MDPNIPSQNPETPLSPPVAQITPEPPVPQSTSPNIVRIILFVILGILGWGLSIFLFLHLNPFTAKTKTPVTSTSNISPTVQPTLASQHITYNANVAGIRNNKLAIFDITNQTTDFPIPLHPEWTYRLSPDKKKIFISTLQVGQNNQDITFYIYDLDGNKLFEGKPILDPGYEKVGLQLSTGFGQNYFSWDENSQGILYFISGLLNVHEGIGENDRIQFRYINPANKTDTVVYQENLDYGEEENTLIGFNKQNNKIIMADIIGPTIVGSISAIDISTKIITPITTLTLPLQATTFSFSNQLSPDRKYIVGELSKYPDGEVQTGTFTLANLLNPAGNIDISSLLDIPVGSRKNTNMFFIDTNTVAITYPFANGDHEGTLVKLFDVNKKALLPIPKDEKDFFEDSKHQEQVIDVNNIFTFLTTKNIIKNNTQYPLPSGFTPIGFIY